MPARRISDKTPEPVSLQKHAIAEALPDSVPAVPPAEQLIAAFILDAPIPIRRLYGIYGNRTTFHRWKQAGLAVKPIEGMGPTVIPSQFKLFLLKQRGDWKPSNPPPPSAAEEAD